MKRNFLLLTNLLFVLFSFGQAKLIEKVQAKAGELTIPYERYQLKNGLTIIVHEDHSDPLVHVDITYHVGSAREVPGKSGFAHFFEHMMFQGSKHVGDDQHFKIISDAGGTLNGSTNRDRTNYFETVPKNQLEVALWLEADRMGFLLDSVTQQKFEVQRATVKNERGQNYDNRPYGLVMENISRAFYPQGHPYSWLTIGYIDHLNAADLNDLKGFFLRWYGPNNAVLSIGGDVNTADVIKLAEKYFGSIKPGPKVNKMPAMQPVLNEDRYVSMSDNIRQPQLRRVYSTVPAFNHDEAPLDMLCTLLSGNKSSVFYTKFIKSQLAASASASNSTSELSGELSIVVTAFPNTRLSMVDSLINSCFEDFEKNGISEDDLARVRAQAEASTIRRLESVSGKISTLAYYFTYTGNPNLSQAELDNVRKVTREDIMRVYKYYIKNQHYVAMSVYPKDNRNVAREDSYTIPPPDAPAVSKHSRIKLRKVKDHFDRSVKPQVEPLHLEPLHLHEVRAEFSTGARFIGLKQSEIPYINLQIVIYGGHLMDAYDTSKAGLAMLTARLMNEGTATYLTEQFENELEKLGSTIRVVSDDENTYINVGSMKKNIDQTLSLLADKLFYPAFREAEFERAKKQQIEGIKSASTQPSVVADHVFSRLIYEDQNIKSIPNEGTVESVSNITLEDVKAFHKKYYAPQLSLIVAAGDIEMGELITKLSFLNNWKKTDAVAPDLVKIRKVVKPSNVTIYFVHSDKAAQSQIRVGYLALPFDATGHYYEAGLMNYMLGGTFNSHLNMNLRENKGWTYGVRSSFNGTRNPGPFIISGGFLKEATDSTIREIMNELTAFRTNLLTDEEVQFTKNAIQQSEALRYETLNQKMGMLYTKLNYNLDMEYKNIQLHMLLNMDAVKIRAIAQKYLELNKMSIVVVGDRKLVREKLGHLGYPVIDLDSEGNIIK
jgi:zinc protease